MTEFGTLLHLRRVSAGLSQTALAVLVGVPERTVRRWERDVNLPSFAHLARLSAVLGVTPANWTDDERSGRLPEPS
jgi:transcriptional regulator with XRE-family HTH domain